MNLDELQSIRDRERQSDSLQRLRASFYEDVGAFLEGLREERETAAERAEDPFDAPEVNRLTDDIKTAEQTVEAVYERRVGKLVKMASFAAADMPTDDEGLTAEERDLFEGLVASIERNREQVFAVVDGEEPPTATDAPAGSGDPAAAEGGDPDVDAADLMGGTGGATAGPEPGTDWPSDDTTRDGDRDTPDPPGESVSTDPTPDSGPPVPGESGRETAGAAPGTDGGERPRETNPVRGEAGSRGVSRTTVRITRDVGEIFGVDEREYDLSQEDVVTLPAANAEPLVERDAAERID